MKFSAMCVLFTMFSSSLFSQAPLSAFDPNQTLTPSLCYELIKDVWDELKAISDEYRALASEKNEFETTADYNNRINKSKDDFINKIRKFYSDNKLNSNVNSVWLKADLAKYDADSQTYGIKSSTQVLIQPKKNDIATVMGPNKYVTLTEKNFSGYRKAYMHLNTNPEFTWFVNKQTAQDAKSKEANIFFKISFSFDITYDEPGKFIVIHINPSKIALMNQNENFTYWNEDLR